MTQRDNAFDRIASGLRRAFPRHVFAWHRASGVTTIGLGTRTQIMAIGGVALIVGWLATSGIVGGESAIAAKSAELTRMQAQLTAMKSTTARLQGEVATRAAAIEKRQAFLAALLGPRHDSAALAALLPRADDTPQRLAADVGPDVAATPGHLAAAASESLTAPFRKLEADQLAFVDRATGAAEARLRGAQSLVRRLGLDPDRLVAASAFDALDERRTDGGRRTGAIGVGGPYLPVTTAVPADAEPRFRSLFVSWKKLEALEAALTVIPSYLPVTSLSYSSGFGVRTDPFTGGGAMHAGVDLLGRQGEPIYAAASGTVSLAGWSGAYGNCVEVAHGKGLSTRYGHLSAILVRPGALVHQGDVIARMGSTGRSTGTHLHFEVRIDGRAVDPRPYLEASGTLLAAQRRSGDGAT